MKKTLKPYELITDFITGRSVPNIGSEENRQRIETFLVEKKGFDKKDIEVDAAIALTIDGATYRSQIDLVVSVDRRRFMAIKAAAGSLDSWKREILSAARLIDPYPLPVSVASDGASAVVMDTATGDEIGCGMQAIPSRKKAHAMMAAARLDPLPPERQRKEMLIFRSYDMMNVNVGRNI